MIKQMLRLEDPGISNKYSINSYYSIGNHTQSRFQSDDFSLIAHYKLLTWSY